MKKLFYPLFAFATLAMTNTSCSDEMENATNPNEAQVSFNIQLESAVGSRAVGDGTTATQLQYYVYKAGENAIGDELDKLRGTATFENLNATVTLTLVKGQTYNFLFWAQSADGGNYYSVAPETGIVTIDYTKTPAANNEKRDAFFKVRKDLKITGPVNETIVLKRPFAQINVGTTIGSLKDAATAEVNITKSSFIVKDAATKLNTYSGAATDGKAVSYTMANIIESNKTDKVGDLKDVAGKNYEYLAMNYILVGDEKDDNTDDKYGVGENKQLVNAEFEIYDDEDASINKFEIPNVPVQRNWRTNIIGDIMNETVTFNVVIDPKFDNDHNYFTEKELAYAFASGGEVTLEESVTIESPFYTSATVKELTGKSIVVNLNGKTLTYTGTDIMARLGKDATLTFNGPGKVVTSHYIASANEGGKVYVNGGEYSGKTVTLFQANGGNVYVSDGTFENESETYGTTYMFNHFDSKKNVGLIEISGGKFKNYNPADSKSENPAMNFVADGYAVKKDDEYYKVVAYTDILTGTTDVTLYSDVKADKTIAVAAGTTLDGQGNTLTMVKSLAQYALQPAGGTIKNLTVRGYNTRNEDAKVIRGIYIVKPTEDVNIEGVTVDGVAYPLNTGTAGSTAGIKLTVSDSKLVGWSSWSGGFASATFTGCTFGVGNYFDTTVEGQELWNGFARPYIATTFERCAFEKGFKIDAVFVTGNKTHAPEIILKGCTLDGDPITDANKAELFETGDDLAKVTVQ